MGQKITRNNHYVPQWYQRGFLERGKHTLQVLNLHPVAKEVSEGRSILEPEIEPFGLKWLFKEVDLYTTRFGPTLNDEIERFLFGEIDSRGAGAVRAWIAGDVVQIHHRFRDFFDYIDAQKLRTPKGLDWISRRFSHLPQNELMRQMQALRQMHGTIWTECVREIVSARHSEVKFIATDHPVTIYHPDLPPDSLECQYPDDPGIELIGSQTLFALDANHCLILTNLEYADGPRSASLLSRRTNARFRGGSLARTDAFIRDRELKVHEVHAINHLLKSRARKFIAASDSAWLYPERNCSMSWKDIGQVLLPNRELWRFGGEIFIGHNDGTTSYRDQFGRSSKVHKILEKKLLERDLAPDEACGCGSGFAFGECCSGLPPHKRPAWNVLSMRERNLILCNAIHRILNLDTAPSWTDVRRNLSNEQVRELHEVFATVWPFDTQLADLLPRPQYRRSRALFLGLVDPRTIQLNVTGVLPYFDEILLVHPFVNANGMRREYSPIESPAKYKEQTLKNAFTLLLLEPEIRAGRVHLVPDPLDYDAGFREEILAIIDSSKGNDAGLGPIDESKSRALSQDEMMRTIRRLPPERMKAYVKRQLAQGGDTFTEEDLNSFVRASKRELENDPFAVFTSPGADNDAEMHVYKGFARETGLYVATMTGSIVYTDSDTQWNRLHQSDGVRQYIADPGSADLRRQLDAIRMLVPANAYTHEGELADAAETRALLRKLIAAARERPQAHVQTDHAPPISRHPDRDDLLPVAVHASIPVGGFQRTDVSRLVLTFGRTDDVSVVALAIFLKRESLSPSSDRNR
jgi:hypothetical protein